MYKFLLFLIPVNIFAISIGQIQLSSKDFGFKLLGDLEGTSIILKIKDKNANTVAVFKPSSGSTNHRGEFASYKLASILGVELYPITKLSEIPVSRLFEVRKLVSSKQYTKFYGKRFVLAMKRKEENRKKILARIDNLIKNKKPLKGALKLWVKHLIFSETLGRLANFKKTKVYYHLSHFAKVPKLDLQFKQYTKIMKPHGLYHWVSSLRRLTNDLSKILVLDAVLGNRDRFPGGNVHFVPCDNNSVKVSSGNIYFGRAHLLSLDNGAVLQKDNEAFKLLKSLSIIRFEKKFLKQLGKFFSRDALSIQKTLGLNKDETSILIRNAKKVLNYINSLEKKYGQRIYFI